MRHRLTVLLAVLATLVVGLGSYAAATVLQPNAVAATQGIGACVTAKGSLRLTNSSSQCASGTTKISLAQAASAPQAAALDLTSNSLNTLTKSLSLIAGTSLQVSCNLDKTAYARLSIVHQGQTQIDGTSFVGQGGTGTSVVFERGDGSGGNTTAPGATYVYANTDGAFSAGTSGGGYATLNAHLLVTVPGAVYTITAVLDANSDLGYCRVSVEAVQAAS
jgi:hypothetical protein